MAAGSVMATLTLGFGRDYLTVFVTSTMLLLIIEFGLAASGVRKRKTKIKGRALSPPMDALLHAMVDGPGFCVPAFFVADQVVAGRFGLAMIFPLLLIPAVSTVMGLADRAGLRDLGPEERPHLSRRNMTRPGAVMLLALLNTICLAAIFLMPQPYRNHGLVYLGTYSLMVGTYYLINYNLGVRMVQILNHENGEFTTPGPLFQAAGLGYDSAYEMALLLSPAYWGAFYAGLFHFATIP